MEHHGKLWDTLKMVGMITYDKYEDFECAVIDGS